jgi:hypothetical protein
MIMRLSIPGQRTLFFEQLDTYDRAVADFIKEAIALHNSRVESKSVFPGLLKISFDEVYSRDQEVIDALVSAVAITTSKEEIREMFSRNTVPGIGVEIN